eukprot:s1749_g3.t3
MKDIGPNAANRPQETFPVSHADQAVVDGRLLTDQRVSLVSIPVMLGRRHHQNGAPNVGQPQAATRIRSRILNGKPAAGSLGNSAGAKQNAEALDRDPTDPPSCRECSRLPQHWDEEIYWTNPEAVGQEKCASEDVKRVTILFSEDSAAMAEEAPEDAAPDAEDVAEAADAEPEAPEAEGEPTEIEAEPAEEAPEDAEAAVEEAAEAEADAPEAAEAEAEAAEAPAEPGDNAAEAEAEATPEAEVPAEEQPEGEDVFIPLEPAEDEAAVAEGEEERPAAPAGDLRDGAPGRDQRGAAAALAGAAGGRGNGDVLLGEEWIG